MARRAEIKCIHCGGELDQEWIKTMAGRLATASRKHHTGPEKKYRPCRWCGEPYGAQELRYHQPRCKQNPNPVKGRPRVLRPCPWCEQGFGYTELQWHKKRCPARPGARRRRAEINKERKRLKENKNDA